MLLNILAQINASKEKFGINLRNGEMLHSSIRNINPKWRRKILIIKENSYELISASDELQGKYIYKNNHCNGLTFKMGSFDKFRKPLAKKSAYTLSLLKYCKDDNGLHNLKEMILWMKGWSKETYDKLETDLIEWEDYISLDHPSLEVQTYQTIKILSDCFYQEEQTKKILNKNNFDVFGGPLDSFVTEVFPKFMFEKEPVTVYSRYEERPMNHVHGLSGSALCPVNFDNRENLRGLFDYLQSNNNIIPIKLKINNNLTLKYLVFATFDFFDGKFKDLDEELFSIKENQNIERFKALLQGRTGKLPEKLSVFVLARPIGKESDRLVYSNFFDFDEACKNNLDWRFATRNINFSNQILPNINGIPESLKDFVNTITTELKIEQGKIVRLNQKLNYFNIQDVFEFIYGNCDENKIKQYARCFQQNYCEYLNYTAIYGSRVVAQSSFSVKKIFTALGIWLYKLGFKKDDFMKETAFQMGLLVQIMSRIEYAKRTGKEEKNNEESSGKDIEFKLRSHDYLRVINANPSRGFEQMRKWFMNAGYWQWMKAYRPKYFNKYEEIYNLMAKEQKVISHCDPVFGMLLTAGLGSAVFEENLV